MISADLILKFPIQKEIYESKYEAIALHIPADTRKHANDGRTWVETLKEWDNDKERINTIYHGSNQSNFTFNQFIEHLKIK